MDELEAPPSPEPEQNVIEAKVPDFDPLEESQADKPQKGISQEAPSSGVSGFLNTAANITDPISAIETGFKKIIEPVNKATGYKLYTPRDDRPSLDEFLGTSDYSIPKAAKAIVTGDMSNPDVNAVMDKTLVGRITQHIGQAEYDALNQGPLGIEAGSDTEKFFKNIGLFNDLQNNRVSAARTIDETFIRPLAVTIDAGWRAATAALGGIGAGLEQIGTEIEGPKPELTEWAMTDIPSLQTIMPHVPKPSDLSKGRELGVFQGEQAYFGLDNPSKQEMLARVTASDETNALARFVAEKQNIDAVVRRAAPETFEKYDSLNDKVIDLRGQIRELEDKRNTAFEGVNTEKLQALESQISSITEKVKGDETRLTNKQAEKLDALRDQHTELNSQNVDTPELAKLREDLRDTISEQWKLQPDISQAYKEASQKGGSTALEEAPTPPPTTERQVGNIVSDVSQKLVNAGRPVEEADAAAKLVAEHYKSVADMGWIKGEPEDIYKKEFPGISGRDALRNRKALGIYKRQTNTIHLMEKANASTFIHETGHSWLEEMKKYAAAKDAPATLKSSMETVNKWLKVDGEITRRQHEKFARGFERYLMEGTAPSQELAGVFSKFKQWLTNIYQTVKNLRSPINDEIRQVFDRLLSANQEKAVIAPEAEVPQKFSSPQANIPQTAAEETKVAETATKSEIKKAQGPTEEPAPAQEEFSKPRNKYVDKAGNIRLDLLNIGDDVKQAIRDAAGENDNFTDWTRGTISDAEALSLSEASGLTIDDIDRFGIGKTYTKEEIFQLQRLLNDASADVATTTKELLQAPTDETRLLLAEKAQRFKMIQEEVQKRAVGARAEAGRSLQALYAIRKMSGSLESEALGKLLKDQTGFDLYQMDDLANAISELDSPGKVAGMIEDMYKPSNGDKLFEVFTNWLISNPVTHAIYVKSNAILALYKATFETVAEAGVGKLREIVTGKVQERAYLGEVHAQLYGMFKGQQDGWSAASRSFKIGQTIELPFEAVDKLTKNQREAYDAAVKEGKNYEQALSAAGGVAPLKTVFTQRQAIGGKIGTAVRIPGERMVAPIHSYFRSIGYSQHISRLAYRAATEEGLEGYAFSKRVNELTTRPTEQMMTEARKEATEQTLMSGGGDLTKRVSDLANWEKKLPILGKTRPLRFINPFLHISSNILEQGILRRTPIGLLSESVMSDIKGVNGVLAQNKAIARMALGTSFMIASGGLAMEGKITPSAPSDPKEAAMWKMVYGMPHAFVIGDMAYDLHKLGSLGIIMGVSADLYHVSTKIGEEDAAKIASMSVHALAQNFLDESFLRGPSDAMRALTDNERYGEKYVKNFVANLVVPYSMGMGAAARAVDPYVRQTRSTMDAIKAKVPWWSETLMPLRDMWGQPLLNREMGLLSYEQQIKEDPVNQRLYKLGYFPSFLRRQILGVELTDQQYDEYSSLAGQMAKQQLDQYVQTVGENDIPPGEDIKQMKNIILEQRKYAAGIVLKNHPEIYNTATANKQSILETGKKANKQE